MDRKKYDDMPEVADLSELEFDERFPSGNWIGWFVQRGNRSLMRIHIAFHKGKIQAHGSDYLGRFTLTGTYDSDSGAVNFSKVYESSLSLVLYHGYNEGKGIWGGWRFPDISDRGDFYIWPTEWLHPDMIAEHAENDLQTTFPHSVH